MALLGSILPLVSQRARFDMAETGGLFLLMNFCMLVSMLALGPLTDKFGKRLPLVVGTLLVGALRCSSLVVLTVMESYCLRCCCWAGEAAP
jgi:MFS family permease